MLISTKFFSQVAAAVVTKIEEHSQQSAHMLSMLVRCFSVIRKILNNKSKVHLGIFISKDCVFTAKIMRIRKEKYKHSTKNTLLQLHPILSQLFVKFDTAEQVVVLFICRLWNLYHRPRPYVNNEGQPK
jgi:hypothetical protein